jgi:low temperature requirement protein LtrA
MTRPAAPLWRPLVARDRRQPDRAATPLELLFDLCFVVAVAQAAARLEHGLAAGGEHVGTSVLNYALVFFAIWWGWVNFTWFASAYDNDDVPYRLLTLLQIAGVLVLAAGVPRAFDHRDFALVAGGYVLLRASMVSQWLRAAHDYPAGRRVALRFGVGIGLVQIGWVGWLLFVSGSWKLVGFSVLAALELAVPVVAEHAGPPTTWHPEHIGERYGLFTLIVLGEVVAAATGTVQSAISAAGVSAPLMVVAFGGLLLIFALWWSYFDYPAAEGLRRAPFGSVFRWGYGHVLVFAALAAVGAGLSVAAETVSDHAGLSVRAAALALAVPTAAYLMVVAVLHRWVNRRDQAALPRWWGAALLVLAIAAAAPAISLEAAVALIGLTVAGLIALDLLWPPLPRRRRTASGRAATLPSSSPR